MTTIYGIPNCDTIKKTRDFFSKKGLETVLHNYKTDGVPAQKVEEWIATFGLEKVVNKKGTTYKALTDEQKVALESPITAVAVLQEKPSVIKRPIIESGKIHLIGFDATEYDKQFS